MVYNYAMKYALDAAMAELVDALRSGRSGGNPVEVQVLFAAPAQHFRNLALPSANML